MFRRKGKQPIITTAKPVLPSDIDLEVLFQMRAIEVPENWQNSQDSIALYLMAQIQKLGDPFEINRNWFIYSLMADSFWFSPYNLRFWLGYQPRAYGLALPIKVWEKIREVEKVLPTSPHYHDHPIIDLPDEERIGISQMLSVAILSADPTLAERREIREDTCPLLVATIRYGNRKYSYLLSQWDLKWDLRLTGGD